MGLTSWTGGRRKAVALAGTAALAAGLLWALLPAGRRPAPAPEPPALADLPEAPSAPPLDFGGRKVGLALGGGAIHGAAHIGVLRALEARGVRPDALAGTSIGALVAALYAFGYSPDEIERMALGMDWFDVAEFAPSRLGLLSDANLRRLLEAKLGEARLEDAPIPLAIVATDIGAGEPVVLRAGEVAVAVMASASVPGVFHPVELDGRMLVDGGLVENVPVSPLVEMGAEYIIAVDLNRLRRYREPKDLVEVLLNALYIAIRNDTRLQTRVADLRIVPSLAAYSFVRPDPDDIRALVREGYAAALRALETVPQPLPE